MRPISNFFGSVGATAAVLLFGGLLASEVPVSMASEASPSAEIESNELDDNPGAAGLTVEIHDVRNDAGQVVVIVYDDKRAFEAYDYESAVSFAEVAAEAGELKVQFPELPTGSYAVSLFHDENDDGDFNLDGMTPLEGYGTSGANNWYDDPTFDEASTDSGHVSVRMFYPN